MLISGMSFRVREGKPKDGADVLTLLPRVGAFPRPPHRAHDELHRSDERVLRAWVDGGAPDCRVFVARDASESLLGFALVRMQPDAVNGEPSAHLETLAVAEGAEGQGVGSALMALAEDAARKHGARSMSLHVFETNERARKLYARKGYVAEWVRCIKDLRDDR